MQLLICDFHTVSQYALPNTACVTMHTHTYNIIDAYIYRRNVGAAQQYGLELVASMNKLWLSHLYAARQLSNAPPPLL